MTARALALAVALLLGGCALPRVTVVDDPLSAEEHLRLGLAYEQQRQWQPAESHLRAAAATLPEAWFYLGNLHYARGAPDDAAQAYRRAMDAAPADPRPRNNLAWLYHQQGQNPGEARRLAEDAVRLARDDRERAEFEDTLRQVSAGR